MRKLLSLKNLSRRLVVLLLLNCRSLVINPRCVADEHVGLCTPDELRSLMRSYSADVITPSLYVLGSKAESHRPSHRAGHARRRPPRAPRRPCHQAQRAPQDARP